jgi:hypothetical protein
MRAWRSLRADLESSVQRRDSPLGEGLAREAMVEDDEVERVEEAVERLLAERPNKR